jgi:chromate reductase, NAD(P)H dehydrogenase (quinone)
MGIATPPAPDSTAHRRKDRLITADGEVTDEGMKQFLQSYLKELHAFIVRVLTVLPREA